MRAFFQGRRHRTKAVRGSNTAIRGVFRVGIKKHYSSHNRSSSSYSTPVAYSGGFTTLNVERKMRNDTALFKIHERFYYPSPLLSYSSCSRIAYRVQYAHHTRLQSQYSTTTIIVAQICLMARAVVILVRLFLVRNSLL